MLTVFDDMIADMEANQKFSLIVTEFFIRGRKLNISLVFKSQPYFKVPKTVTINVTHYFIIKITNKKEFQKIESNHASDIELKNFMKRCKDYT